MDALEFFPSLPKIDAKTDENEDEKAGTNAKKETAEGFELIAVKEGLAGQQNFEISIVGGAEFFAAGQVIADFLERDAQVIRIIDQEQPRVSGVGEAGEVVGLDLAQAGHRDPDILGGLLELDA